MAVGGKKLLKKHMYTDKHMKSKKKRAYNVF